MGGASHVAASWDARDDLCKACAGAAAGALINFEIPSSVVSVAMMGLAGFPSWFVSGG